MRIAATFCALLAVVAFAGCGGSKKTVSLGGSSVTTSDDNKTTTVTTGDGSVSVGSGAVDVSKLGAPPYPGATSDENGGGGLSFSSSEGSSQSVVLKTTDSFDKVYDFYKAQLPAGSEKMKMSAGGGSLASFQTGDPDKDAVTVMITGKDAETTITISHTIKNASAAPADSPAAAASPAPAASSDTSDGGGS